MRKNQCFFLKNRIDYYPFGMPMPNRQIVGGEQYRYSFQGQEKDPETGKEAFQLRLWDGRIGRWLTTDPAGQYSSPYLGMGNNPMNRIDPDGGIDKPKNFDASKLSSGKGDFNNIGSPIINDWYRNNTTNKIEWFDGNLDIEGYKHIGFILIESSTDSNNNTTLIKYDGNTKSSFLYNSETAKFDFLKNYNNSANITRKIGSFINAPIIATDQLSSALVNGFQGAGIMLYESIANGRDIEGMNAAHLGYKPLLDITSTRIYNNGKWVNVNVHSRGEGKFMEIFATNLIKITPFKANLFKNKWVDKLFSSKVKTEPIPS